MATGGIFLFGTTGGGASTASNLVIDADVQDYNVLTEATALGYDNSAGTNFTIRVTINSGANVTASASGGTAFTTGALNANTTLIIINSGNIQGANGGAGGAGATGGSGGKGIYFNSLTGGVANHSIDNTNGTISGGGGGGGGGGGRTGLEEQDGNYVCGGTRYYGAAGAVGALGAQGGGGGLPGVPPSNASCSVSPNPGTGGAGGYSIDKNGRTVSTTPEGTYNGSIAA